MIAPDRHSRRVAWLKVALPLTALALLSTLFLVSRAMKTQTVIPFAATEIQNRARDQQITGPFFSGTTSSGGQVSFSADKLVTLEGRTDTNRAEGVSASLNSVGGARFELTADVAELDIIGNTAVLSGQVNIITSQGYHLTTSQVNSKVSDLEIEAPEEVHVTGPLGDLTAGKMRISTSNDGKTTQMLFRGGIKLIYSPN